MNVEVVEGDITQLDVDAIANAANNELWMGAGVAGAIKRAGGAEIEREAMAKGPIEVGSAVATSGGELRAAHVVHGAVMGQDLRTTPELIGRTTTSCLVVADGLGRSLARAAGVRYRRRRHPGQGLRAGDGRRDPRVRAGVARARRRRGLRRRGAVGLRSRPLLTGTVPVKARGRLVGIRANDR